MKSKPHTFRRKEPTRSLTPALRSALIAAGILSAPSLLAQVQTAGELFVDIDATQLPEGPLPSIQNKGTLGGFFEATGGATTVPVVATVGGTKGIQFDGGDLLQNVESVGGPLINAPAGLVGEDPTRSIEVWALNPATAAEETLVSWGRRGGPDGSNMSFGYGSDFRWGAVGHWGGDGPDLGWSNDGGAPAANKWHHLVYTLDGNITRVYVDGVLANGEILEPGRINTHPDTPISIAAQIDPDGVTPTAGLRFTGTIARVRVHDGVLTPAQVASNYNAEKAAFIDPAPPPPIQPERIAKGPVNRYSFGETAGTAAEGTEFRDSVGTAHGKILGEGAEFTGGRLRLPGGGSSTAAYADLPNGMVSRNGVNNSGTGEFTFETWFRITGARQWSRVFDFGSTVTEDGSGEVTLPGGGGEGRDYLALTAQIDGDVNSRRLELRNEDPGGGGIVTADSSTSTFNTDTHLVVTWNESTGRITLYEDGVEKTALTTDDAMSDLNDVNVWLGRSNWTADQNTQGEYDEARFYDYVLTPAQIVGNSQAGPTLINNADSPVTLVSQPVDVSVPETLAATFRAQAQGSTPLSYQWYRNGQVIPGATGSSYTVPAVSAADNGAQFTVEASNLINGTPVKVTSNPARLTVVSDTVTLKHRYSFSETSGSTIADSVGGANGQTFGGATLGGGQLTLDGTEGTYADLPNHLVSNLGDNATFEMWVTYAGGGNWSRIFDMGTSNSGEDVSDGGTDYIFYSPKTGPGYPRFEANFPNEGVSTLVNHPGSMPLNEQEHIVITYSYTGRTARLYTNGTHVATGTVTRPLSALNKTDVNIWLGRSQFADPYYNGTYNEFRIYQGAMTPSQVAASFAAGPDNLPAAAPSLGISRDGTTVRVTFEGTLESAPEATGPWTAVPGAVSPMTIGATDARRFYRARR